MPRMYRVPFNGTVTAAGGDTDLVVIQPADDKPCRLVGWMVGQETNVSDANEKELRLTMRHMTATVTVTGGSSITPVANRPGTNDVVAAGFTTTSTAPRSQPRPARPRSWKTWPGTAGTPRGAGDSGRTTADCVADGSVDRATRNHAQRRHRHGSHILRRGGLLDGIIRQIQPVRLRSDRTGPQT